MFRESKLPALQICLLLLGNSLLSAQSRETASQPPATTRIESSPWQFETLVLNNGTEYAGLVQAMRPEEIEFAEIFRKPGQPMSAVIRAIDPADVVKLQRLPSDIRQLMMARFQQFKDRAAIEAGSMQAVVLKPALHAGRTTFQYDGRWFALASTADEESTRRSIVRIEQIFGAFRQLLPPRVERNPRVRILLFGSLDEYHTALRKMKLAIDNLAVYTGRDNTIVAGAEISTFARELAKIRAAHEAVMRDTDADYDRFREQLAALSKLLARRGFTRKQITDEMALRKAAWNKQYDQLVEQINEANRRNEAKFNALTDRTFRRLYHEAFHAYLQNYVFPPDQIAVDRWLNEGLAQIFEAGQLDANTLRIDAPPAITLRTLQHDLQGPTPLRLATLLKADDDSFLATHRTGSSQRHYLYAWGLTYYLVFEQGLLRAGRLDSYLANSQRTRSDRFEQLVGMPLSQFEAQWRYFMLRMQALR